MKAVIGMFCVALGLSACGPAPGNRAPVTAAAARVPANEMTVDTLQGGAFRGRAGSAWTRDEVASQVSRMECGGKAPRSIVITPISGGGFSFNGAC